MLREQCCQPFSGARAPTGYDDNLLCGSELLGVGNNGIEDIFAIGLAFWRERSALPATERDNGDCLRLWALERIERDNMRRISQLCLPFLLVKEHAVGGDRMIRRRAERLPLQRLCSRIVVIRNLLKPVLTRIVGQRIECDNGARQIVEQRVELLVEQRQPVLHALMLLPRRYGFV